MQRFRGMIIDEPNNRKQAQEIAAEEGVVLVFPEQRKVHDDGELFFFIKARTLLSAARFFARLYADWELDELGDGAEYLQYLYGPRKG